MDSTIGYTVKIYFSLLCERLDAFYYWICSKDIVKLCKFCDAFYY